jgi:hypothetical protein
MMHSELKAAEKSLADLGDFLTGRRKTVRSESHVTPLSLLRLITISPVPKALSLLPLTAATMRDCLSSFKNVVIEGLL